MAWVGLVRDLGTPPPDVVRNERALGRATIERIARQLAAHVDREALDAYLTRLPSLPHFPTRRDLESKLPHIPTWAELEARLPHWPTMAELEGRLPHLPSVEELRERARRMIPETPSMDDIVVRAREVIAQARLAAGAGATTPA
jgi:stearoyl-CoA desaturase (delta-9 desaturase)